MAARSVCWGFCLALELLGGGQDPAWEFWAGGSQEELLKRRRFRWYHTASRRKVRVSTLQMGDPGGERKMGLKGGKEEYREVGVKRTRY